MSDEADAIAKLVPIGELKCERGRYGGPTCEKPATHRLIQYDDHPENLYCADHGREVVQELLPERLREGRA